MRKKLKAFNALALILSCAFFLTACAHQVPTRSGFLADYAELQPLATDAKLETTSVPGDAAFGTVIIDDVQFAGEASVMTPDDEARKALCRTLEGALLEEFSDLPPTGSAPARTLRVKAAITGVDRSRPLLNLVTTLALFVPVDNGGVSVEIQATDDLSGQRIAAMSGARNGSPFALPGFFHRYGHAEEGLKELAKEFRHLVPVATSPTRRIVQN